MFCPSCGSEIRDPTQKYCELCGELLPKEEVQSKNKNDTSEIDVIKQEINFLKTQANNIKRETNVINTTPRTSSSRNGQKGIGCCCFCLFFLFIIFFIFFDSFWWYY
ncbi:MAG: zinc-ribbon domain-containing protein [Candidatus Lokiarchaeota archaeon]|nr:zinc-ribbon domain-containing protein [Candidatus Lokiarchaeota archaeon]